MQLLTHEERTAAPGTESDSVSVAIVFGVDIQVEVLCVARLPSATSYHLGLNEEIAFLAKSVNRRLLH
jgi:hypothetical protein